MRSVNKNKGIQPQKSSVVRNGANWIDKINRETVARIPQTRRSRRLATLLKGPPLNGTQATGIN